MRRTHLLAAGLVAAAAIGSAACTSFESGQSISAPTAPSATTGAGGLSTGALVGLWASQSNVAVPSASSCGDFEWRISSQTASAIAGTFIASCDGGLSVSANASGVLNNPTNVTINVSGTALVGGVPACSFSLTGTGNLVNNDTLTIPYTGTTCLGPVHGTETLRRHTEQPAPPPATDPAPPPSTPPSSGGALASDAIDFRQATILNSPADLATWPPTAAITAINLGPNGVHVEFTKQDGPGRWPDVTPPGWSGPLQYTLGMAENIDGRWYASAVVEFWYGLYEAGGAPSGYAQNWFYDPTRWAPMTTHQPAVGEMIGFFVCAGDCRNNPQGSLSPVRERSNVVLVPMPDDGGSFHAFQRR